jgi:glycosyltransferase involved in cell wall biosynthesis
MLRSKPAVSTVWLDVSLLLAINTKQPTGIPRTTISVFRAWWDAGYTNLRLCLLDPVLEGYFEVHPLDVLARFDQSRPAVAGAEVPAAPPRGPSPLRRLARRVARQLPAGVKTPLRHLVQYVRSRPGPTATPAVPPPPVPLGPSDLVVSLGGGWTQKGGAEVCERLQARMGFRSAHLIYDMIPLKHPQFFPDFMYPDFDGWMVPTARYMDLAVAISEHTKRDLAEFCEQRGLRTPATEVVRLGEGISPVPAPDYPPVTESFNPREPFVLCVGTLEVRKNHHLLYHVWRRLAEQRGDRTPKLVIIGSKGWLADDILHMIRTDPLTKGRVVVIPHCDDAQLRWLYQQCLFTVYPSHYEGWGLPIAESLAFGKHCVCSSTSSMPEIAPDLVEMHDPCDLPGCLEMVTKALDPAHRAASETRIRQRFAHTPWAETGRQFAEILDKHFGQALRLPEKAPERLALSA